MPSFTATVTLCALVAVASVVAQAPVPATVVVDPRVMPPTNTISSEENLYDTMTIGPAGWACTALDNADPDTAYRAMKSYFEGGNSDTNGNPVIMSMDSWPVMELFGTDSKLCVYLDRENQCYPPNPVNDAIKGVNEHFEKAYYGRKFWGQSSDARVTFELAELTSALADNSLTYDPEVYYVMHWPDQMKEVRLDKV